MKKGFLIVSSALLFTILLLAALLQLHVGQGGSVFVARNDTRIHIIADQCARTLRLPNPAIVHRLINLGLRLSGKIIQPGWYHVSPNDSQLDVILMLVRGKHEPYVKIVIPEGFTMFQIASRLHQRAQIDSLSFIHWCTDNATKRRYSITSPSMDGFLKPATYFVIRGESASYIATIMADEALRMWKQACKGLTVSRDSIITLASIIQREAARNTELARIAGVYHNRLQRSMRLEADPTLQYGRDIAITSADLRDATNPYNTYQHSGLPPGPISNPGIAALEAALRPEHHNYVFFVARGDSSREHRFAETYSEHLKNVQLYRNTQR